MGPRVRNLTLKLMVWSAPSIVVGVELRFAITDDQLEKKSIKFISLRPPLVAILHQDDLRGQAHRLSYTMGSRMTSIDDTMRNASDNSQMIGRVLEGRRIMERVAKVARVPALLPAYL
jgi:hypothetical protein